MSSSDPPWHGESHWPRPFRRVVGEERGMQIGSPSEEVLHPKILAGKFLNDSGK